MIRPPEFLVLGNGVFVTGRVAAYLLRYAELDRFRREHRGDDREVDATLVALTLAALTWRGTATGTTDAPKPEPGASSSWLSTEQAVTVLGIRSRAVRKAIAEGRLKATNNSNRWRISTENLAHYRANRDGKAA